MLYECGCDTIQYTNTQIFWNSGNDRTKYHNKICSIIKLYARKILEKNNTLWLEYKIIYTS